MQDFFITNQNSILSTIICIAVLIILRFISAQAIRKVGRLSGINKMRTKLVVKYTWYGLNIIAIAALIIIWGVDIKELTIIFSSVFAVLGVVLFASWSILSNVTAGVILFFSFPFKIGDRIRIQNGDIGEEVIILDIKAFYLYLQKDNGELITYPNNMLLQKGVALIEKNEDINSNDNN